MSITTKYIMRGQMPTVPFEDVTWAVYGAPDNTGAQSGFVGLINIYVDYTVDQNVQAGGNQQAAQIPVPAPPGPIVPQVTYVMKALLNASSQVPNQQVTWRSVNAPDFTGTLSGFNISELSDIIVDYTINDSVTSGPQPIPSYVVATGPAGGDLSGTYPNPTVVGLQTRPISSTAPTTGQVLTWNGTDWIPSNTGSTITWADDLAGSTNTDQFVASISGPAGAGGVVPINATTLQFSKTQVTPSLLQEGESITSSGSGAVGQDLTIAAQPGQSTTALTQTGGRGGNVILESGATGTGPGGNEGPGAIELNLGTQNYITLFDQGSGFNIQVDKSATTPIISQQFLGAVNTTAGQTFTIQAQRGSDPRSGNQNGGAGGPLVLSSGPGGTHSGSGVDGLDGTLELQTGTHTKLSIAADGYVTLASLAGSGTGIVSVDNTGKLGFTTGGGGSFTPGGDLSGTSSSQTVIGLYNNPLANMTPVNSAVPVWDSSIYDIRQLTQDDILPGFSISTFAGGSVVEIGATVTNPAFTASYSSLPTSAAITNTDGTDSPHNLTTPFTSATISGSFHKTTATSVTFTLTAIKGVTKTSTQAIAFEARSFGGVGAAGATSSVTASGNNAVLSTGDTINSVGLHTTDVGQTYGPFSPSAQKIYLLLVGGSHTFKDASTGFSFAFNTPTSVSFVNQNSATVAMFLYESTNTLTGSFSIQVVS